MKELRARKERRLCKTGEHGATEEILHEAEVRKSWWWWLDFLRLHQFQHFSFTEATRLITGERVHSSSRTVSVRSTFQRSVQSSFKWRWLSTSTWCRGLARRRSRLQQKGVGSTLSRIPSALNESLLWVCPGPGTFIYWPVNTLWSELFTQAQHATHFPTTSCLRHQKRRLCCRWNSPRV